MVSTTVTTGAIASYYDVRASNVGGWTDRFTATFVEYRIVKARFHTRCFSSTNPGLLVTWFDEKNTTTVPLLAEAQQKMVSAFSASDVTKPHTMKWCAQDPLDLQYTTIATTNVVPVTYKVFTNNANFGASTVATPYLEIVPEFLVQFRGLQGT